MRDAIFATSRRYLILQGNKELGEVYVLDSKYIFSLPQVKKGLICRKSGKSA